MKKDNNPGDVEYSDVHSVNAVPSAPDDLADDGTVLGRNDRYSMGNRYLGPNPTHSQPSCSIYF